MTLKAPFPYFGGKSKVAAEVWARFGDVKNYVEPFCGSAAVLLARPHEPRIETVNDANCFIANFWRALKHDPEAVAHFADWPVNEADLHARHRWLMLSESASEWRERMKTDPDFYDAKVAGWWVWGASCWIGAGWCDGTRLTDRAGGPSNKRPETRVSRGVAAASQRQHPESIHRKRPALMGPGRGDASANPPGFDHRRPAVSTAGNGVHAQLEEKRPKLTGWGETGVHRKLREQLPDLAGNDGAAGRGVHRGTLHRKLPDCGKSSRGDATARALLAWFDELEQRLRRVRVVCGDWKRVCTPAVTSGIGLTGVFLDPPYSRDAGRTPGIYSEDDLNVAHQARAWAIEQGNNPDMRIALCGYEGEHELPEGWTCFEWQAQGGYANQRKSGDGYANRLRERIWFSPHCLGAVQERLIA